MEIKQLIKKITPYPVLYFYYSWAHNSYSQAGQDIWVYRELFRKKRKGFFVDLGSADGLSLNNTFLLEARYKWKGICIEANPDYFKELAKFRRARCINICIDEKERNVFFKKDGLTSMINFEDNPFHDAHFTGNEFIKLRTDTLENVFKKYDVPKVIDYLSVDIEGAEYLALRNFPFNEYCFKSITIERPNNELRAILKSAGYVIIKEIPNLDVYYLHKYFCR